MIGRLSGLMHIRVITNAERTMTVVKSRTFRAGNSEAVRLPREVAFGPDPEVTIVRHGDV